MSEKNKNNFPLFFASDDGVVHIKVINSSTKVYVRTLKKDNFFDYCLYRCRYNPDQLESIQKIYLPSTEEAYLAALRNYFSSMASFSQLLEQKAA